MLICLCDLTEEASVYFFWDFPRGSDLSQSLGLLQRGESCIAPVVMGIISYLHHHLHRNRLVLLRLSVCICLLLQGSPHIVLFLVVYFVTLHRKHFHSLLCTEGCSYPHFSFLYFIFIPVPLWSIITLHTFVLALLE